MIRIASILSGFALSTTIAMAAVPATQPDPQALHAQAIEAMRAGKSGVAATLMEKAYAATLAEQRTRPLVLNRAIIDLTQRTYGMRAVRELADYLRAHEESDEQAHDILGAALNAAAKSPRIKQGEVWQAAYREWARRDEELNISRPGYRRFGPYWLDDAQFAELESDRTQLQRAIDAQADRVGQAESRVGALVARRDAAWQNEQAARQQMVDAARELRQVTDRWRDHQRDVAQYERNKVAYDDWVKKQQAAGKPVPPAPANPQPVAPSKPGTVVVMPQTPISPTAAGRGNAGGVFGPTSGGSESERLAGDIHLANGELRKERERLATLKSQLASLNRPQWPTTFDPIDPSALTPPPPPPPDPKAVAALLEQAKSAAAAASGTKSPFDQSGTVQRRTGEPALPARGAAPAAPTTEPAAGKIPFGPRTVDR